MFRWSALGVGVVYGIVHRNSLVKQAEHKRQQAEYAYKEELIKEAKAEYQKHKNGSVNASSMASSGYDMAFADGVAEIDWNDGKSIEAALQRLAEQK